VASRIDARRPRRSRAPTRSPARRRVRGDRPRRFAPRARSCVAAVDARARRFDATDAGERYFQRDERRDAPETASGRRRGCTRGGDDAYSTHFTTHDAIAWATPTRARSTDGSALKKRSCGFRVLSPDPRAGDNWVAHASNTGDRCWVVQKRVDGDAGRRARATRGRARGRDGDGDTRRRAMAFLLASNIFAFKGAFQAEVRRALVVARTDGGDVDVAGVASSLGD
jgi:hypothetical protein